MSNKNFQHQKNQQNIGHKVATGILVLTGFASLTTQSGLVNQLTSSLEQYLLPSAQAKTLETKEISILDEQLIQNLGTNTVVIDGKAVFVVSQAGEKEAAPNGYYKLSNGLVITVKDGKIANQATLQPNKDQSIIVADKWKQRADGSSKWKQNAKAVEQPDLLSDTIQASKVNVRDTLNKIIGA